MRRSEKLLLGILVGVLLAWQGWRLTDRLVLLPIRRSQAELELVEERVRNQTRQVAALSRETNSLRDWQARSLPPDPLTAQRLYQQWLTDLAQHCGFTSLNVFPDRVAPKNDGCVGVLVSIDGEVRLSQLCLFLSRFYRTDLAQQITALNIDSLQDRGDPILRVTVLAEGLALQDAEPRQQLFPTGTLADDVNEQATLIHIRGGEAFPPDAEFLVRIGTEYLEGVRTTKSEWTLSRGVDQSLPSPHASGDLVEFIPLLASTANTPNRDYDRLVANNPFAKPTPQVVQQPRVPEEKPPEIDPAEFTYLVAAFAQDDQRQAWLYDRLNNQNVVIDTGQPFVVAGIEGLVHTIGNDFIVFQYAEARWRLKLGKNLRSMERVAGAGDP